MSETQWEVVEDRGDRRVERLRVPGAWIYLVTEMQDDHESMLAQHALVVPFTKTMKVAR
jgi:hypothetical protein